MPSQPNSRPATARLAAGLMTVFACAGCLTDSDPAGADPQTLRIPTVMTAEAIEPGRWPSDRYSLNEAKIEGDRLVLEVQHGGGCKEHEYKLVVSDRFRESEPVQAEALLSHDAHGDLCKALVHAKLEADLTPLKKRWQSQYQRESGRIQLRLEGVDRTVVYSF